VTSASALSPLVLAAALAACSTAVEWQVGAGGTYVNPVLDRDFPDPAVLRAPDGWFYAFATQTHAGHAMLNIQVARSRDLVGWEHLGEALAEKPRWAFSKQDYWAPHVIFDAGLARYFMYYSAEPDGPSGKCLAVATASAPQGPFTDSGEPLLCGEGVEHIDPMAFDDPKTGKRLLYWGSGSRPIKVQELARDRLRFSPGSAPAEVVFPDAAKAYRSLVEAVWVVHRDGVYFLFYSGDRCCGSRPSYALMVARARDAFGPFEHFRAPDGTSAILRANSVWRAPGHNSVATDAEGNDWILYHAYRSDAPAGRERWRVMLLDRLVYRDGWPRIEGDEPSATPVAAPAVLP
jgi:arabinan endo-1,5-alpha-L-arabinosidase